MISLIVFVHLLKIFSCKMSVICSNLSHNFSFLEGFGRRCQKINEGKVLLWD